MASSSNGSMQMLFLRLRSSDSLLWPVFSEPCPSMEHPLFRRAFWAPCQSTNLGHGDMVRSQGNACEPGLVWARSPTTFPSPYDVSHTPAKRDCVPSLYPTSPYRPPQPRPKPIALPAQIPGVTHVTLNPLFHASTNGSREGALAELAALPGLPSLTLLSPKLLWWITAHASSQCGVSVRDVLEAIQRALALRVTKHEFNDWVEHRGYQVTQNGGIGKLHHSGMARRDLLEGRGVFRGISESKADCDVWVVDFI
ncbi:hypothetical protein K438DRAFT_1769504 [Mycena galopus ATCC 62051]|nr:hypothetical protein K438DRAFT_1769504 [Mycena galopus ATCC 62051]